MAKGTTLALVLANALVAGAVNMALPAPTDPIANLPGMINEWSPVPTDPPYKFDLKRMFKRQASLTVCGYLSGLSGMPTVSSRVENV